MEQKKHPRIIFMGTPKFSADILSILLKNGYDIVGVFTQPDKKVGRKQMLEESPVKILAKKNDIATFTPRKMDPENIEKIRQLSPDLIVLVAYGKILPQAVLDIPKFGAVNIHPSLLPKFRGSSPIQNALLTGEDSTGTTIMLMDAGMDTGDILRQEEVAIGPDETYPELEERLIDVSSRLLLEVLPELLEGEIVPLKQDSAKATYCRLIKKADGQIDWNSSADDIYAKFRAFASWPGIFTYWDSKRIKLNKVRLEQGDFTSFQPGEVFSENGKVLIKAGISAIAVEEIQPEGKSNMKMEDFLNSRPNFIGSILSSNLEISA